MIILQEKLNHNFSTMTREDMYVRLYKQYKNGFMIIPAYLDVVYTDEWNEGPELEVHKAEEKND